MKSNMLTRLIRLLFPCKHVFRGVDMAPRNDQGVVKWSCCKCGKVFDLQYGLEAPGRITGPWS